MKQKKEEQWETAETGGLRGLKGGVIYLDFGIHRAKGGWGVDHVPTGLSILAAGKYGLRTKSAAMSLVRKLYTIPGNDWAQTDPKYYGKSEWTQRVRDMVKQAVNGENDE